MECRFCQRTASELQTAFVVSHKMLLHTLITGVNNYNNSYEKLQDFFASPRPSPTVNVEDEAQDEDFMIQHQNQDFHFGAEGASTPKL